VKVLTQRPQCQEIQDLKGNLHWFGGVSNRSNGFGEILTLTDLGLDLTFGSSWSPNFERELFPAAGTMPTECHTSRYDLCTRCRKIVTPATFLPQGAHSAVYLLFTTYSCSQPGLDPRRSIGSSINNYQENYYILYQSLQSRCANIILTVIFYSSFSCGSAPLQYPLTITTSFIKPRRRL